MRKVQLLLFYLLLVCQTTESLIDKLVKLGQNVTLDCLIGENDIYWVFQKPSDSVVSILRTFTLNTTTHKLYDKRFRDKYSSLTLSRLFITNVTIDELGIYYCAKSDDTLLLSDGIRLEITAAQDQNETELNNQTQQTLIVFYVILSIVLFSAVIGLFQIYLKQLKACQKRHQQCQDEELEQLYSTNGEEFSEVEFHLFHSTNNTFVHFQRKKLRQNLDKSNQE
ncbi:hypothetical protein QQF64_019363 [Cirrhinus molitorella]|uniref:Immunoglobulin domain-containing protein n=1 Tax=Cirrhinus molitorella TaxID=172907 RepID=A0ABR3LF75_9TELE